MKVGYLMNHDIFLQKLKEYAQLTIQMGLQVKKNDEVTINIAVDQVIFARLLVEAAYSAGAKRVIMQWQDPQIRQFDLNYQSTKQLEQMPTYQEDLQLYIANHRVKRLTVMSNSPDAMQNVNPQKIAAAQSINSNGLRAVRTATENNQLSWTIIAAASPAWAKKVFPNDSADDATQKLWQAIFKAVRIDLPDPIAAWQQQIQQLDSKASILNQAQFDRLHYVAPGTDLTIGLPKNHVWQAAGATNEDGDRFIPNMPTEEVFTAPDANRVDGYIRATKPLSYAGTILTDLSFTFKAGRIMKAEAATGNDVLQHLLKTDLGARRLGEVALVPDPSPISQSGITFFNTLFDENASNHLAIGAAYPFSVVGGTEMNQLQLQVAGLNVSQVHVDFMVGSDQMAIDGITQDGKTVPIFRHGDWV